MRLGVVRSCFCCASVQPLQADKGTTKKASNTSSPCLVLQQGHNAVL